METPKSWAGLMVKLRFKCEETIHSYITETEHCVVVKYTGTFKGKNHPTKLLMKSLKKIVSSNQ